MTVLSLYQAPNQRGQIFFVTIGAASVIIAGVFSADLLAYLCIAIPALVPIFLWLRAGGRGIPVLPIVSALFFIYYAIPILRSTVIVYDADELLDGAAIVGSFLTVASIAYWPFLRRPVCDGGDLRPALESSQIVFFGLWAGIIYYLSAFSGNLDWLGFYFGLVRALVLTFTSISCFILGSARASGLLVGRRWGFALCGLAILILLSVSGLALIGGVMNGLAAFVGYSVSAKRLPWIGIALAFSILSILQAGKEETRRMYWVTGPSHQQEQGISRIPGMMFDWFSAGMNALASGSVEPNTVLERASLLQMVLYVHRATPESIPYLDGETYASLSSMLIPRFLSPEKISSQSGSDLLSVRYHLQSSASVATTAIGWGLVAEAYANFGYWGVVVVGVLFGILCGASMRISMGASIISLRMFVSITATVVLLDLEATFAYLLVTLAQSIAGVLIVWGFRSLSRGA